jgi:hypothetical protein
MTPATPRTTLQAPDPITCARPGCGALTTAAESTYVDGCGQICPPCDEAIYGPRPEWSDTIRPPY